jgi:type II secretory pathway component PulJ
MKGQRGVTLMDVVVALVVTSLSVMTFFQLFAFGAAQIEKLGYRREAMSMLKGELEFWRARFQTASVLHPVSVAEAEGRKRTVIDGNGLSFEVASEIDPPARNQGMKYQRVRVQVSYARVDLADTVELETRLYVW